MTENYKYIKKTSLIFMVSIFGLSSITIFNTIFYYLGLGRFQTVLSTGIFAILDIISIFYIVSCFKESGIRSKKIYLTIAIINFINFMPSFFLGDIKAVVQDALFVAPFTFFAAGLIFIKQLRDDFFHTANKLNTVLCALALGYIGLLWYYSLFSGSNKILNIEVMTYGNIAWFFAIFLFLQIINLASKKLEDKYFIHLIYSLILIYAIFCTGLRTAIVSLIFLISLSILYAIFNKEFNIKEKRSSLSILFICILFSLGLLKFDVKLIPSSSRSSVIQQDILYDLKDKDGQINDGEEVIGRLTYEEIVKRLPKEEFISRQLKVGNMQEMKISTLDETFRYYIFSSTDSEIQTVKKLHEDIKQSKGQYILVNKENIDFASQYQVPRSRNYLWLAAINEFNKNRIFGNGLMHFQKKYVGTFPHNVLLEALSDFGIVGVTIIGGFSLILFVAYIYRAFKRGEYEILRILLLASAYIPSFFIYTSLYRDTTLTFLLSIMIFYFIKRDETRG